MHPKFLPLLLTLVFLMFSAPPAVADAGCFIWKDNTVLMVRDVWTKRWSLPGGTSRLGEVAEQTALRELAEETGITARVVGGGGIMSNNFTVFACEPVGPIVGFTTPGGFRLRLPKGAMEETLEARFLPIETKKPRTFRFPEQREDLLLMLERLPSAFRETRVQQADYLYSEGDSPFSVAIVQKVQSVFHGKFWNVFFRFFSFLGEEPFFFVVIPFLFLFWVREQTLAISLLILSSAVVSALTKNFFGTYRPFEFLPGLEVGKAYGFSFPSGHAILTAAVWMFWAGYQKFAWRVFAVAVVFLACLSRLQWGAHFLEDVLAGAAVGTTMALLAQHWVRYPPRRLKGRGLHLLGLLFTSAALVLFNPATLAALAAFAGLFLALSRDKYIQLPLPKVVIGCVGVMGFVGFSQLFGWITSAVGTASVSIAIAAAKYAVLGAWLGCLSLVRSRR